MIITFQNIIPVLPLIITSFTAVIILISILFQRNHVVSVSITLFGFICALLSIIFLFNYNYEKDISFLIHVDIFSLFFSTLIIITGIGSAIFAYYWLEKVDDNKNEFYFLILMAVSGGVLLSISNHMVSLFIGIELITLPLFGLIVYSFSNRYLLEAGIKYMLLSSATSFLLFGIALLYAESGNLSFISIIERLSVYKTYTPLFIIGLGMFIVGLFVKLSLFPFHLWTPDVYQGAPVSVSSFLSTGSKIAIFSILIRLFIKTLINNETITILFLIISITSIFFGNILGFTQKNLRRLFAYSSISNMGYLLAALVSINNECFYSKFGIYIYLVSYTFSSLGIFCIVNIICSQNYNNKKNDINLFQGLFWYNPLLAISMTIMLFSLIGIPVTLGFISKFYLIFSVVNAKLWWLTCAIIIGNIIGIYYYLRLVTILYIRKQENNIIFFNYKKSILNIFFILICDFIIIFFGIYPKILISIVSKIII